MRPFEVGDLIIVHILAGSLKCNIKRISENMLFCNGGYEFTLDDSNIKTIRKPRAGSKESRDIVAMILIMFRKFVQFYIFVSCGFNRPKDNEIIKHYYRIWKKEHYLYQCYEKAKQMLERRL